MSDSPVIDEITPDELYQDIRRGSRPFILDVRNEEEFANWAIEGLPPNSLLNIPYFVFLEDEAECLERVPARARCDGGLCQGGIIRICGIDPGPARHPCPQSAGGNDRLG